MYEEISDSYECQYIVLLHTVCQTCLMGAHFWSYIYISKFTAVSRRIAIDRTLKFQAVYKYTVGCTVI